MPKCIRMRTTFGQNSFILRQLFVTAILCLPVLDLSATPVPANKPNSYPVWWFSRGVILPTNPSNPLQAGLRTILLPTITPPSIKASSRILPYRPIMSCKPDLPSSVWSGTAGTNLTTLVTNLSSTSGSTDDYAAVNLGQLKAVAQAFYNLASGSTYPWSGTADDYAVANIGQVKNVFSRVNDLKTDLNYEVDSRIAAATGTISSQVQLFTSTNDTTYTYVRNTATFLNNLDFTGVSVERDDVGSYDVKFQISLITPVDAINIAHANPAVGTHFRFVDGSNTTYTATVAASTQIDGFNVIHLTWSGSTPTTLKIYKTFPANFQNYTPGHSLTTFPVVGPEQWRTLSLYDVTSAFTSYVSFFNSSLSNRSPYAYYAYSGDSGFPQFCVVNNDLVLLSVYYSANAGPTIPPCISDINTTIAGFTGDTYTIGTADLSGFLGPY